MHSRVLAHDQGSQLLLQLQLSISGMGVEKLEVKTGYYPIIGLEFQWQMNSQSLTDIHIKWDLS